MKQLIPRKFERKRIIGDAVVKALGPSAFPIRVQVLDLCQSGLAFFAPVSFATGQIVEVAFQVAGSVVASGLETRAARVVRSRALSDGNIVGIAFAHPLEAHELTSLEANWVRS